MSIHRGMPVADHHQSALHRRGRGAVTTSPIVTRMSSLHYRSLPISQGDRRVAARSVNEEASYMVGVLGSAHPRISRARAASVAVRLLSSLGLAAVVLLASGRFANAAVSYRDFSLPVNDFPQGIAAGDC